MLQELELPSGYDISVNDAFRPLSRFFDRVWRPEQLPAALLGAMRVLTDPAETGAVTLALPQDVQAEAHDWPQELFAQAGVAHPAPGARAGGVGPGGGGDPGGAAPVADRRGWGASTARPPRRCGRSREATGIPVADTQAGKGAIGWDHPQAVGGVGSTGSPVANALARDADVVIGVGTRYSDFTTASRTAFQHPGVRFVNLNVAGLDAAKHAGVMLLADARNGLEALTEGAGRLPGRGLLHPAAPQPCSPTGTTWWTSAYHLGHQPLPAQTEILGALNETIGPDATVVQAAGSMPGDLQMLWRAEDPKQYHVEYAYSCMGYEIAGALGIKMAAPEREVYALVGDGSYLMMAQEIVTAVSEGIKLNIVIVQNHGFSSIGALSESLGSQRFGTYYRYRNADTGHARRRHAADRPGRQRREPGRRRDPGQDDRGVPRRRSTRPAPRPAPPPSTSRPTRSPRCRPRRAGGTCRSPRSPRWTAPSQARKTYEAHKAEQRACSPRHEESDS